MKKKKEDNTDLIFVGVILNAVLVLENLINLWLQMKR